MSVQDRNLERWNKWFDSVSQDLVDLHYNRAIYREIGHMVDVNPEIQRPSSFFRFLRNTYVMTQLILVRRQAAGVWQGDSEDKRSISFARLLLNISKHPEEISRQRFYGLFAGEGRSTAQMDRMLEAAGVKPTEDALDYEMVKKDLNLLTVTTKQLKGYADKMVAHVDTDGWTQSVPTFGELDDAIDFLGNLGSRYSILLRGREVKSFEPIIPPTWKSVFTVAWIPSGSHAKRK